MHSYASNWFLLLVDKKGSVPTERLLAVFSVAEQLLLSKQIKNDLSALPCSIDELKEYLTYTASSAKAVKPVELAGKLLILFLGAIAEEMHSPGTQALQTAMVAAKLVIDDACKVRNVPRYAYGLATFAVCVMSLLLYDRMVLIPEQQKSASHFNKSNLGKVEVVAIEDSINPSLIAATFALHERVQKGLCPAPHLLDIPEGQMIAYMNVISIRTPDNPAVERENLKSFLNWYDQEIERECYYPRTSGHAKVNWR